MKRGFDSAYPPTPAQIAAAKAAGIDAWLGYFAGPNILNGWSEADFQAVMNGGLATGAYCSGWSDPAAMKAQAAAWGVPVVMLDDESAIRSVARSTFDLTVTGSSNRRIARTMFPHGEARPVLQWGRGGWTVSAWVQPWLDASGGGLYGNLPVFAGAHASRYVFAAYPGTDPGASWPSYYPRPADGSPCGWQWEGTHAFAGISVDSTYFDDGFWALGPHPGSLGDDDMLYVGPFHALSASLKVFASAGTIYSDPATSAMPVGTVGVGASVSVDGYLFSSSGVQSSDRGGGAGPGIDYVWWHRTDGNWQPDNDLITVGVSGAPIGAALSQLPAGMKLYLAKESELSSVSGVTLAQVQAAITDALSKLPAAATMDQVNQAITAALAKLPAPGLSKDQVDQEILIALGNLPKPPPGPHHHGVLGIINTGPVIPD